MGLQQYIRAGLAAFLCAVGLPVFGQEVVINEIMYNPPLGNPAQEWIELHNRGTAAVNVAGWRFTDGINFIFPNLTIPAGGYLVVAADEEVFSTRYPTVGNMVGGWTDTLSNNGEGVELQNASGQEVDRVRFANNGDWGTRRRGPLDQGFRGWEWFADHDGIGKSLELINAALPNEHGQNWASSVPVGGTPGTTNSVVDTDGAPIIVEVAHFPVVPSSSSAVTVSARIIDEQSTGIVAHVFYRTLNNVFAQAEMFDDGAHNDGGAGDGVFAASLPAVSNLTVVEFFVRAIDRGTSSRTYPAPALNEVGAPVQQANLLYQVDDSIYGGAQPFYRIIMTEAERVEFEGINRGSDAEMNCTFVTVDGIETQVRHMCGVRIRGAGSRGRNPPNYRVNIPNDTPWKGVDEINLNTQFTHVQLVGSAVAQRAGLPTADARLAQVRVNGRNLAGAGSPQFGSYVAVESINGDWAENHFPDDSEGNVYRASTGAHSANLSYLGTDRNSYLQNGYTKTSNQTENDWSDLINLTLVLNNTPDSNYTAAVSGVVDVRAWMKYFAVHSLMEYSETSLGSGRGDDYAMYRGIADPRFWLIPHDLDTIFGQGDTGGNVSEDIFVATNSGQAVSRFLRWRDFVPLYYEELNHLINTTFSPAELFPLFDRLLPGVVPQQTITVMKSFATNRTAYVRSLIRTNLTVTPSSVLILTNRTALNGFGNMIRTRSVLVNGVAATWNAVTGGWSAPNVALVPGMNRVLVQARDASGQEFERIYTDVRYDDGSVGSIPTTVGADMTLTAAGGPYHISNMVTVASGATLMIEPGTTLYFEAGAGFVINGRLLAEGTETRRIRFTRPFGGVTNWNGIRFNNSTQDNRITYADIEFAAAADPIVLVNSTLLIDNVVFSGTTRTIIDLTNSSLICRNSIFPRIVDNETIHGQGMPANGYVIIEGNFFGGTTGYSDIIDFTGGRRPGPILQVLNNIFDGGSDDGVDIDNSDAHIEGNVFRHIHQDAPRDSESFAIATDFGSEITVVRNFFYDNDHAVLLKNGSFLTAENNTIVGSTIAAVSFDETNRNVNPGRGALIDGCIFWNNAALFRHLYINDPVETNTALTVVRSITQGTNHPGAGNIDADPLFVDNANDFHLRPGSPAIGTGPNGLDMGAHVPAGASISGEPPALTARTSATLTVDGPGITHYRYRLNNAAYGPETPIAQPISLTGLANGNYRVFVIGKNSAGAWQDTNSATASRPWSVNSGISGVRINEVLARNESAVPVGGEFPDLIELYNAGDGSVDLGGMGITDDPAEPFKFRFAVGTTLAAGQYLTLHADNMVGPGIHLGFALSQTGDEVLLYSAAGVIIDRIAFGLQIADFSIGRLSDNSWGLTRPTFGSANIAQPATDAHALLINEWLASPSGLFNNDFVELYNTLPVAANFGGAFLTDAPQASPTRHTVPALSFVPARGFVALLADGNTNAGADHLNFRLSGDQGEIALFASDQSLVDCIVYGPQTRGIAEGRIPNGSINVGPINPPTPGGPNPSSILTTNLGVVVNEVMANNVSIVHGGQTNVTDWVELYNASTNAMELSDISLTDNSAQPRRWVFPAGVTIPANGYLLVRCDGVLPASTNASGNLNTGFGLSAGGDGMYLYDSLARGGGLLNSVVFGIQAPDLSIGRLPNGVGNFALNLPTPSAVNVGATLGDPLTLRINEWLANPTGNDDDFFELYNPNNQPVQLGGLIVADSQSQYRIPDLSFVGTGPDGFVRFVADSNPGNGADHTNFRLSADGETIRLLTGVGAQIDAYSFGPQQAGVSEGRFPDGSTDIARFPGTATPGASNLRPITEIVISEVLTHTDLPLEDAIELQNVSNGAVDISGWWLSDRRNDPKKFRILQGTVLQPGAFVVLYERQFNPFPDVYPSFSLSSVEGDDVYLFAATPSGELTGYRTGVEFGAAENAVPFGRHETSVGFDFTALSRRTFGADSPATVEQFRAGTGVSNAYPKVGPIVISEVMYHPPDLGTNENFRDEFIELHNVASTNVALFDLNFPTNTWRLRDAVDFDFPQSVTLAPGAYLLVVSFNPATDTADLNAFRTRYGLSTAVRVFGPYQGRLANDGENVELYKPDAPQPAGLPNTGFVPYIQADKVKYSDAAPWASAADLTTNGVGASLQRRVMANYGNDPVNWLAGVPTPGAGTGTGVAAPPMITSQPVGQTIGAGSSWTFNATANGTAPLAYQWRLNGVNIPGAVGSSFMVANAQFAQSGRYSVLVMNPAGAVLSAPALLTVQAAPVITQQPQSRGVAVGGTAILTVVAQGTVPLAYQWRRNGTALGGATNATLTIANMQAANEGDYTVVVANNFGSVTSIVANLSISTVPAIVAHPQSRDVFVGADVTFNVAVSGSQPLRYQWRFNNVNIAGATNSSLTLANVQLTNSGNYAVFVTNEVGAVLSTPATLTVTVPPVVTVIASDAAASEPGANSGAFSIRRTGPTTRALLVEFVIAGTAVRGSDFSDITSPVLIQVGAASASIPVTPINDALREGDETVVLRVTNTTEYVIGAPTIATVVIRDEDNAPPSVTITNPVTGVMFNAGADVLLGAMAADSDGSIAKVEFYYQATNRIGEVLAAPFVLTWSNAPGGSHDLTAIAFDDLGSTAISSPVNITVNRRPTIAITTPTNGATFSAPANIAVNATASDADGAVAQVEFYSGANPIGLDTSAPFSVPFNNVAAGTYALTARATDNQGATSTSAVVTVTVAVRPTGFADMFANRGVINGFTNFLTGNTSTYTKEPGEPAHDDKGGAHSAWIEWVAPGSGTCAIDTFGSFFDTVLAVYRGTAVASLTYVGSNDDDGGLQSRVTFAATAGVSYVIAVDGFGPNEAGNIVFHLGMGGSSGITITQQPTSQVVTQGNNASFSIAATGTPPLRYQWFFNTTGIPTATNITLLLTNVRSTNQGTYRCVVSNATGFATSVGATLTVLAPPSITQQPASQTVDPGGTAVFVVSVAGSPPLRYQWRFNGANIADATNSTLVRNIVQHTNAGVYQVGVLNSLGSVISQPALLSVRPQIVSARRLPNGEFEVNYRATPGNYVLEFSADDLLGWSTNQIINNIAVDGQVIDINAAARAKGFYRLRDGP